MRRSLVTVRFLQSKLKLTSVSFVWLTLLSSSPGQIMTRKDAVGTLLNQWYRSGTAAGLSAITYENRDGGHSPLDAGLFPQLTNFVPDGASGPPVGPPGLLRLTPTVGNCSMAMGAALGGSLPRIYQINPDGAKFQMMQYLANNLFIFPEHQDHDIGANGIGGYGDLFPANNCCSIISQGSSLSDQPFLQAVLATISAFTPETQELLIRKRILMPTLQSIFRQSNKMVQKPLDYLSGIAHPVVFDAAQLDVEKMVRMAQEMTPAKLPPVVQVSVVQETELMAGKDYFEAPKPLDHRLADTPVSISRIMRGTVDEYGMVIHVGKTADLMQRPVKIIFQLLQGDPNLVRLDFTGGGPYARLRLRWHPPMITSTGIRSHRVDIGVFASNGVNISAPAIISFYMLPNEQRFYDERGQLTEIDFQTYNPDLGLPTNAQDLRWLRLMLDVSIAGDGLRSRLMEKLLSVEERKAIQAVWKPLDQRQQVIRSLAASPEKKESADRLKAALEKDMAGALATPLPGGRGLTVRSAISRSLDTISTMPDLYLAFQSEINKLAAASPKPNAAAELRAAIQRLIDIGVLREESGGTFTTVSAPDKLSAAERHYLRGVHLTVLSHVLFAESLERSTAPAWVDLRLTTPKPWRDVFRHDADSGKRLGWVRYRAGHTSSFDAEGRLRPEAPRRADKTMPVSYERNAQGLLDWRQAE